MEQAALPLRHVPLVLLGFVGALVTRLTALPPAAVGRWLHLDPTVASLLVYVAWSLLAAGLLLVRLRRDGLGLQALGWRGWPGVQAAAAAALGAAVAVSLWPVVTGATAALGIPLYWDPGRQGFLHLAHPADAVAAALLGLVLVPAVEETLFRGYLLQALVPRLGLVGGTLAHNLTFAAIHAYYGPGLMAYIFVWATVPAWLFLRYRNLHPAAWMHALNNAFADLVVPLLWQ